MPGIPLLTIQPLKGRGGPPIQHINFLRQMQVLSDRYDFHALIPDDHGMNEEFAEVATLHTLPELPTVPRTRSPVRLMRYYRLSKRIARDIAELARRIDAKIIYTVVESFHAGLMAGRILGVPTVAHVLGMSIFQPRYVALGWSKVLKRLADRIIGCQEIITDKLHRLGIPREHLRVVYNGVDTDAIRAEVAAKPAPDLPADVLKVGMVAGMDPRKGHINLIEAAAIVCRRMDNVRFYSIGSTNRDALDLKQLVEAVERHGVAHRYTFTGAVDSAAAWMAAMDVYTNPSFTEALSIAVIEAMALSRPIIASDVEGNTVEVAHGETGLLSRPADPADLAEKLMELLNDPLRRAAMGEAGRQKAEQLFTLEKTSRTLLGVLDELVDA